MKKSDYNCVTLCRIQASLFYEYDSFTRCSPSVFIRRFMNSKLAKRFDDYTVLLDNSTNQSFVEELDEQYGPTSFGKISEDKEPMYWVGYVYRYWCYVYEIPSKVLINFVQPKMLLDRYHLYHSMDIDYAIERICEEESLHIAPQKSIDEVLNEYIEEMIKRSGAK